MNKEDLLQSILAILQQSKEDKQKLQKIYDFCMDEIIEEEEEDGKIEVPAIFKSLVHDIAETIDCGHICYFNTATLEHIEVPKDIESSLFEGEENPFQKELDKINEWVGLVTIEPLESWEVFKIMEGFVNTLPGNNFQYQLQNALRNRKPFAGFKHLIDNSPLKRQWFDYKQSQLEGHVFLLLEKWLNQDGHNKT